MVNPTVEILSPKRADDLLSPGTQVGEYRIDGMLGMGGMGVVYLATQPLIEKRVAIKIVRRDACADLATRERLLDEARAVNRICHPNIVDIFSFGALPDGRPFFVMELLDGESLRSRAVRARLPAAEVIDVLLPVCRALQAAHEKGIVHRDLKPDNIFLARRAGEPEVVKLLDFGLAKLETDGETRISRTGPGNVVGTPLYLAPEQARGQTVDWRCDVYSLGVVAFELFLGRPPFLAGSPSEVMLMHITNSPPRPSSFWPEIPPALDRLLLQMLHKEAAKRPSVAEVAATLSAVRVALQANAEPEAPTTPMRCLPAHYVGIAQPFVAGDAAPPARWSRPRALMGLAIGFVAALALAAPLMHPRRHPQQALPVPQATPPPTPLPATPPLAPRAAPPDAVIVSPITIVASPITVLATTKPKDRASPTIRRLRSHHHRAAVFTDEDGAVDPFAIRR